MLNTAILYNLEPTGLQVPQHTLNSIVTIVLVTCIVLLILSIILLLRNNQVFKHRINLINLISGRDMEEILKGIPYTGSRFKMLSQVSYYKMVLKFWKPLDSFFNLNDILK